MNNEEKFKKAMNNIHPSEDLVNNTINKVINHSTKEPKEHNTLRNILSYSIAGLSACIAVLIIIVNVIPLNKTTKPETIIATGNKDTAIEVDDEEINNFIKPFSSQEELEKMIDKLNNSRTNRRKGIIDEEVFDIAEDASSSFTNSVASAESSNSSSSSSSSNYSKTNVQVEGVDEADIIKTDGKYIYMVNNDTFYVLDTKLRSQVKKMYEREHLILKELYVTADNVVLIGCGYRYDGNDSTDDYKNNYYTNAIVLDKKEFKEIRTVSLAGTNVESRLIGDNLYFVTNLGLYSIAKDGKVPTYMDTAVNDKEKEMLYSDIYHVEGYEGEQYINVCAFNIKKKGEVNYKSFFGFRPTIYCSSNNMYFINQSSRYNDKIDIIKMKLDNSKLTLEAKATLKGYINDQFSVDEYEGNLRVATTEYTAGNAIWDEDSERLINHLFILNEKLEVIGQTEDYAVNERIYAVRFVGKIGYVVTLKQVDPLFVMDLSDPTNPQIKGKLKVPGYSSYLHPYDETHIIGIGYNVESNGYGGVRNDTMKMSMFDVSDLNNPKELYSIDIGKGDYVSSDVIYNHKALLYDKERSLIGFPLSDSSGKGFVVYKIEKDGFEKIASKFENRYSLFSTIKRIIYIEDTLYALSNEKIVSFNLYTMEEKDEYELEIKNILTEPLY